MTNKKKFLDQAGVEYLWSKIDMQDYPNNETLIAVINAIDENKADKNYVDEQLTILAEKQADWSQTDETAPDYIKNKPDEADALELVAETGLVEPMTDENGSIFTDENGAIYTLI